MKKHFLIPLLVIVPNLVVILVYMINPNFFSEYKQVAQAHVVQSIYRNIYSNSDYSILTANSFKVNKYLPMAVDTYNQKKGALYAHGDKTKKLIALTFDDGPDRKNTPQVLDILKKYNVKATFFVVGKQVVRFPEVAKRIVAEGHAVGNHTFSHIMLKPENPEMIKEEILKADTAISQVMGVKTNLFRPPYGFETPKVLSMVNDLGFNVIMWSADPDDWRHPPVTKIINYELNHAKNGAIILNHSGEGEKLDSTMKSLPEIITLLRAKGFEFVTIPELLNITGTPTKA